MIPYFSFSTIDLVFFQLQVWGLFVSLGILISAWLILKLIDEYCFSREVAVDLMLWVLVGSILGARFFYAIFYEPSWFLSHPIDIIKIWQGGASSFGGFIGAFASAFLFMKKRGFSWREILPYFDLFSLSLWLGWGVGRIGCFMIHDHPGKLSNFFLAINFPGGARWDMGFLESLVSFVIFMVFFSLRKKILQVHTGFMFFLSFAVYAVIRFFMDFLRAEDLPFVDTRYFYLTPAQWGMLAYLVVFSVFLYKKYKKSNNIDGKIVV